MAYYRYGLNTEALDKLRTLVDEATVTAGSRKIQVKFEKLNAAHRFLDRVAEDEDLIQRASKRWHFGTTTEWEDGKLRLRPHVHVDPPDLTALIAVLELSS